jgi:hypothetical protein
VDRETCADCGKEAPQTETNYTLISAQFGWRLTRSKTPSGDLLVEWRCPSCWREYKRQRPGTITGSGIRDDRPSLPPAAPPPKTAPSGSAVRTSSPSARPGAARPSAAPPGGKRPSVPAKRKPS